mmetsp:Transcript_7498/g.34166  ORF Transcript_7498/g.34166 Transcript_7498/m.34166 type:complete len:249 (+) Transcript_7498:490-1236(+)
MDRRQPVAHPEAVTERRGFLLRPGHARRGDASVRRWPGERARWGRRRAGVDQGRGLPLPAEAMTTTAVTCQNFSVVFQLLTTNVGVTFSRGASSPRACSPAAPPRAPLSARPCPEPSSAATRRPYPRPSRPNPNLPNPNLPNPDPNRIRDPRRRRRSPARRPAPASPRRPRSSCRRTRPRARTPRPPPPRTATVSPISESPIVSNRSSRARRLRLTRTRRARRRLGWTRPSPRRAPTPRRWRPPTCPP